ncbi:hypothetical protein RCH15_002365 [Arthrobacter sp. MP_M4]|nr:hypothetical protein [Arthrobacter sp. MP_M4]
MLKDSLSGRYLTSSAARDHPPALPDTLPR